MLSLSQLVLRFKAVLHHKIDDDDFALLVVVVVTVALVCWRSLILCALWFVSSCHCCWLSDCRWSFVVDVVLAFVVSAVIVFGVRRCCGGRSLLCLCVRALVFECLCSSWGWGGVVSVSRCFIVRLCMVAKRGSGGCSESYVYPGFATRPCKRLSSSSLSPSSSVVWSRLSWRSCFQIYSPTVHTYSFTFNRCR